MYFTRTKNLPSVTSQICNYWALKRVKRNTEIIYINYAIKRYLTGGSVFVPVNFEYWNITSFGLGPRRKNTSIIPLSENQWVSSWGIWVLPFTKSTIDETTP